MGIKKNAYFRDMVRVALSEHLNRFSKDWVEVWKPLLLKFKGSVDSAIDEVLKNQQYLQSFTRLVTKEKIADWLKSAEIPQPDMSHDIIQEERAKANRPEMAREASCDKIAYTNPDIFFPLFRNQAGNEYSTVLKDQSVRTHLNDILQSNETMGVKVDEVYLAINNIILKEYYLWLYRNFKFIDENVQKGMPLSMSHLKTASVNRVIIGYLNSLDQRI